MFFGGLWDIYVGIIEADTNRYQLGSAELREWFTWLDGTEAVESDVLLGVSTSHNELPAVGLEPPNPLIIKMVKKFDNSNCETNLKSGTTIRG